MKNKWLIIYILIKALNWITKHVKKFNGPQIHASYYTCKNIQSAIYSSTRTNIMYSTIRLYTTELNAKALESAERIGGTAAALLQTGSPKWLLYWSCRPCYQLNKLIEVELYVEKYTNTPSAPSYCTRYFFKSMPPPNYFICSLKWLGKWVLS